MGSKKSKLKIVALVIGDRDFLSRFLSFYVFFVGFHRVGQIEMVIGETCNLKVVGDKYPTFTRETNVLELFMTKDFV